MLREIIIIIIDPLMAVASIIFFTSYSIDLYKNNNYSGSVIALVFLLISIYNFYAFFKYRRRKGK